MCHHVLVFSVVVSNFVVTKSNLEEGKLCLAHTPGYISSLRKVKGKLKARTCSKTLKEQIPLDDLLVSRFMLYGMSLWDGAAHSGPSALINNQGSHH